MGANQDNRESKPEDMMKKLMVLIGDIADCEKRLIKLKKEAYELHKQIGDELDD